MKLLFVYFWLLWFWRRVLKIKLFLTVFHFLFGNSRTIYKQILKRATQGTFLQKISPLGVVGPEKMMFKEKFTRTCTRSHDIRSE
jgi:hypothetical protein